MAITDWPEDERPRERLLQQGATALSDAELLALFLRVGVKGKSAVDLARELIGHFGSLNRLFSASQAEFSAIPGMGPAKYAQLQAVLEMSRRALAENLQQSSSLTTPAAVRDFLRLHLAGLRHEVFFALWLDAQHRLITAEVLFSGSLTQTSVYPREVIKHALAHNAAAVIFAHLRRSRTVDGGSHIDARTQAGFGDDRRKSPRPFHCRGDGGAAILCRAGHALAR